MSQKYTLKGVKTATITSKGQISIPREIRRKKGFKEGEKVAVLDFGDHVEVRPLAQIRKAVDLTREGVITSLMSESALAKEWNTPEEDEAWKDL